MTIVVLNKDKLGIAREVDVVAFRNRVREYAAKIGMSILNQTKLITAASELVRNMLKYAGGGVIDIEVVNRGRENGIRLCFTDNGPGIPDLKLAMKDGYSSSQSMGLGLPGAKRGVSEFYIRSEPGAGTTVTIIKWKNG